MFIIVRNNDAVKAYKVLMRKLKEDGFFRELKEKQFFKSKSEKAREKHKYAVIRHAKDQAKRKILQEKQEKFALVASKRRAKEYKSKQKFNKK